MRRGKGVRIRGGTARAYYVGIESVDAGGARASRRRCKALCVAPFGMEEGTEADVPRRRSSAWSSASRREFRFFAVVDARATTASARCSTTRDATSSTSSTPVEELVDAEGARRPGELVPVHARSRT